MVNADFKIEEDALGIKYPLLSPDPLGQGWLQPQFLSPLGAVSLLGIYRISDLQPEPVEPISSINSLAISPSLSQENFAQTVNPAEVRTAQMLPIQRKPVENLEPIADSDCEIQPLNQNESTNFAAETKNKESSRQIGRNSSQLIQQKTAQDSEAIAPNIQEAVETIAHADSEIQAIDEANQNKSIDFVRETKTEVSSTQIGGDHASLIQRETVQNLEAISNTPETLETSAYSNSEKQLTDKAIQNKDVSVKMEPKTEVSFTQIKTDQSQLIQRETVRNSEAIAPNIQETLETSAYSNSEKQSTDKAIPNKDVSVKTEPKTEVSFTQIKTDQSQLIQQKTAQNSEAIAPNIQEAVETIAHPGFEARQLAGQEISSFENINTSSDIVQPLSSNDKSSQAISNASLTANLIEKKAEEYLDSPQSEALGTDRYLVQRSPELLTDLTNRSLDGENSIETHEAITQQESDSIQLQRSTSQSPDSSPDSLKVAVEDTSEQLTTFQQTKRPSQENEIAIAPALPSSIPEAVEDAFSLESGSVDSTQITLQPKRISSDSTANIQPEIVPDQVVNPEAITQPITSNPGQKVSQKLSKIETFSLSLLKDLQRTKTGIQKAGWRKQKGWSVFTNHLQPSIQKQPEPEAFTSLRRQAPSLIIDDSNMIQRQDMPAPEQTENLDNLSDSSIISEAFDRSSLDNFVLENFDQSVQRSLEFSRNRAANLTKSEILSELSTSLPPQANSVDIQKSQSAVFSESLSEKVEETIAPSILSEVPAITKTNSVENLIAQTDENDASTTKLIEDEASSEMIKNPAGNGTDLRDFRSTAARKSQGSEHSFLSQSVPSNSAEALINRAHIDDSEGVNSFEDKTSPTLDENISAFSQEVSAQTSISSEISSNSELQLATSIVPISKPIISEQLQASSESTRAENLTLLNRKVELDKHPEGGSGSVLPNLVEPTISEADEMDNSKGIDPTIMVSDTSSNLTVPFLQTQHFASAYSNDSEVTLESNAEEIVSWTTENPIDSESDPTNQSFIQLKLDENQKKSVSLEQSPIQIDTQGLPESDQSESILGASNQTSLPEQIISETKKFQSDAKLLEGNAIVPVSRSLGVLENLVQLKPMGQAINLQRSLAGNSKRPLAGNSKRSNTHTTNQSSHSSSLINPLLQKSDNRSEIIERSSFGFSSEKINSISAQPFQEQQNHSVDAKTYSPLIDLQTVQNRIRNTGLIQAKSSDHRIDELPKQDNQSDKLQTIASQISTESTSSDHNLPSSWSSLAELAGEEVTNTSKDSNKIQRSINYQHSSESESENLIFTPEGFHRADAQKPQSVKPSRLNLSKVSQQKPIIQADRDPNDHSSFANQSVLEETIDSQPETQTKIESDHESDHNLQILAQVVYGQLRQKLAIERERQGYYSGRLPW
jgi:hypothetical protein